MWGGISAGQGQRADRGSQMPGFFPPTQNCTPATTRAQSQCSPSSPLFPVHTSNNQFKDPFEGQSQFPPQLHPRGSCISEPGQGSPLYPAANTPYPRGGCISGPEGSRLNLATTQPNGSHTAACPQPSSHWLTTPPGPIPCAHDSSPPHRATHEDARAMGFFPFIRIHRADGAGSPITPGEAEEPEVSPGGVGGTTAC